MSEGMDMSLLVVEDLPKSLLVISQQASTTPVAENPEAEWGIWMQEANEFVALFNRFVESQIKTASDIVDVYHAFLESFLVELSKSLKEF